MKRREIIRFVISGSLAVATDFSVYFLLKNYFSTSLAKGYSFVAGTMVAYLLNKYWTFQVKEKSLKELSKFMVLYAVTLSINVAVNHFVLYLFPVMYFFAFLCSTGTSTILNFVGQKWWVFKEAKIS